jgi:TRAP-type C4-dicarboxylate transport system permease small subunit
MVAIIVGLVFIAFAVFAVLPFGPLNWWAEVIDFLKGSVPVIALFIGLIAVFIGIADIKDRIEAKKEEEEEKKEAEKSEAAKKD